MRRRTFWMTLALWCALTVPVAAQSADNAPGDAALAERKEKAARVQPYEPGSIERFLNKLESGSYGRIFTQSDGFGVRIGGIESGAGMALGPQWRSSAIAGGRLQLSASAARSIGGDTAVTLNAIAPHVGSHRISLGIDGDATRLVQARFFGLGSTTARADETSFGLRRTAASGVVRLDAGRHLQLTASAGVIALTSGGGKSVRVPSIEQRFDAGSAPALEDTLRYQTFAAGATFDYRDVPGNPRAGGRYAVGVSRFIESASRPFSYTRVDTQLEQHIPFWRRQRLITLRAIAAATIADAGHDVPFYMQPTLGGSRALRGFVRDRFRDRNVIALQAEYAWDVLPFMSALAFVEGGTTAARWSELDLRQVKEDYGLGVRLGSARTVALRTDIAFGSGEGTRLTMRLNHAF